MEIRAEVGGAKEKNDLFDNVSVSTYVYNKSIDHILISVTNLKTSKKLI